MRTLLHIGGFVFLIGLVAVPTMLWIFYGGSYCEAPKENGNLKPSQDDQIGVNSSSGPEAKRPSDSRSFLIRLKQRENEKADAGGDKGDRDPKPQSRVVKLLCKAELTDLLIALFTYCLVVVGAYQAWLALDASTIAKDTAEAAKTQTRAMVASQLPIVAWSDAKLTLHDALDQANADIRAGEVFPNTRPVFRFTNTGPTKIVIRHWSMKWEITADLGKEPHFGSMQGMASILDAGMSLHLTTAEIIRPSAEEAQALLDGIKTLYAYAFVIYTDFLDEGHQTGTVAKWDPARGFVFVERDGYSYARSQKKYT